MQQQPVVFYSTVPAAQPQVSIQTLPQQTATPAKLRHKSTHMGLSITQMVIGGVLLILEVIGLCVRHLTYMFGSGIYSGIIFLTAGLLGLLACRRNSQCLIVACLVMSIVGACVAAIAIGFTSLENSYMRYYAYHSYSSKKSGYTVFQEVKQGLVITGCLVQLVITIVHAAFACSTRCRCCNDCCDPGQTTSQVAAMPTTVVIQQPVQPGYLQTAQPIQAGTVQIVAAGPLPTKGGDPAMTGATAWAGPSGLPPAYSESTPQE